MHARQYDMVEEVGSKHGTDGSLSSNNAFEVLMMNGRKLPDTKRKIVKARRGGNNGRGAKKMAIGTIKKYFVTKNFCSENDGKRPATDMHAENATIGGMVDEDGSVHGRNDHPKRTRMMNDLMTADKKGPKSRTLEEPSVGDDSDSSQWTNFDYQGLGRQIKVKKTKNSHGSLMDWGMGYIRPNSDA